MTLKTKSAAAAFPRPPSYVLGVDVSRYNGKMDWQQCYQAGGRVALLRAAVGPGYNDPTFARNYAGARDAGLLVTAYFVVLPSNRARTKRYRAEEQVAHFREVLADRKIDLPVVIDAEVDNGYSQGVLTALLEGTARGLHDLGGFSYPAIYTRKTWWDVHIRRSLSWSKYPLHVAHYTSAPFPWLPADWQDWKAWQFTNRAPGVQYGSDQRAIDLSYFKLTAAPEAAALPDVLPVELTLSVAGRRYAGTADLHLAAV